MDSGLEGCQGARDCLGAEGVLRVSLGCCVSFFNICNWNQIYSHYVQSSFLEILWLNN